MAEPKSLSRLQERYLYDPPEVSKSIHESIEDNPTISYNIYDSLVKLGMSGLKLKDIPDFIKEGLEKNKDKLSLGTVGAALNLLSNKALKDSPFRLDVLGQYASYQGKDLDIRLGRLNPSESGSYYPEYDMYFDYREGMHQRDPEVGLSITKRF